MTLHLIERQTLIRANNGVMLTLVCGSLAVCALTAAIYDIVQVFTR